VATECSPEVTTPPHPSHAGTPAPVLLTLPVLESEKREPAISASKVPGVADTDATRLGKAVHRVLEWATASAAGSVDLTHLAQAAAAEFSAPAESAAQPAGGTLAS